ncbi:MAG: hypothetical protein A2V74_10075 [Acidobacteria bacterium RBG_16_70_10]|nr:MAG: hypothetical protein A2V74_10075 [Acidobacteria bacterium RBG_16_70_10]
MRKVRQSCPRRRVTTRAPAAMAFTPAEFHLTLRPRRRFEAIDVNEKIAAEAGDLLQAHRRTLYCSPHTTAGYLEQSLSARMHHHHGRVHQFFDAFRALFPPNADYRHDQMELRAELSDEQKEVEPRNADSHLTFIGSGMRNCVTYRNQPLAPVYFIDLDGTNGETPRRRQTTILAYDEEQVIERASFTVPVSRHPIDSVNLADPRLGLIDTVNQLLAGAGLGKGRVDIALGPAERSVGLTVNEYETMLMKHDLVEVLHDPLKFAVQRGRHMIDDPLAIPSKTINYAKYDLPRLLNSLIEALHWDQGVLERLMAKVMAVPARRLLRSRRVSFLASDRDGSGRAQLLRGTYQSPILVQWQPAESQARRLEISLVRLR